MYGGNTYLCRIKKNDIQAIQASGPQGFDTVPGFTLTLADADKSLWTNHCFPHGWRGAAVTLTVILWDLVTNSYSTDAMHGAFIGGNPQHNYAQGETTIDVQAATNFTRLKVPSVPLGPRCPWSFPTNSAQRASALNDPTSIYYQCGYSPDQAGGVGNYATGTTPFTTCDLTRSSPSDPSVGCMARMGDRADTSISPDGNLLRDIAGHYTGRFGGNTWIAPAQYSGRNYTSGNNVFGFNQPNTAIPGSYITTVYGTQWVAGQVMAPAGEPNSLRSEVMVCEGLYGQVNILKVVVSGVELPFNNSDVLFTWRVIAGGGRNGVINRDAIYNSAGVQGPDPGGSLVKIEFVVPVELANPGSVPSCQVLLTGPPLLRFDNVGNPSYTPPDLYDGGGTINSSVTGPAANLVWAVLDLIQWGNISLSQIDWPSWYAAAQIAATSISYTAADGSTQNHAQFKASFALQGNDRKTLAQVLTAVRNAGNLMIAPNTGNGLIQCFIRQSLADQQPSAVPGSNTTSPTSSVKADGTSANGYFAYLFDETNIDEDSFKVTTTPISSTPNTVSIQFQDEQNGYTADSLTEIDPTGYAYSGNQEIAVPVPFLGGPNFDQNTRVANVQLAEALFGNPRNDPGGTLYFEFTCNQRVLHLTNRLGYICGLTWQALGIGGTPGALTSPQAVRVISLKPDTDGEKWNVKCAWHQDDWYEYAYGQNPAPFQTNPLLNPPARPPYPWRPGGFSWGGFDSLFPTSTSFGVKVNTANSPVSLDISGRTPNNVLASGYGPLVPLQAATANTGGAILPGQYFIAVASTATGPVSSFITVVVPAGTSTNTISFSNVQWRGTAASPQIFVGESALTMRMSAALSWTGSSPDANGNPTAFTIGTIDPDGIGLPDVNFSNFWAQAKVIVHGGVWGAAASSVGSSGGFATVTFAGASFTTNQWAGYTLSAYQFTGLGGPYNWSVSSNTADTLTLAVGPTHGPAVGVALVMRALSGSITTSTIGDANFVNIYAPSGLTVNAEAGNLIRIIAGTGARQPAMTIKSNTTTVFTIIGNWYVTPDATSVFIVEAPTWQYVRETGIISNDGTGSTPVVTSLPLTNFIPGSYLVQVLALDSAGNTSPESYAPIREIYVPDSPQTVVTVTANYTVVPLNQNVMVDSTAGAITITVPDAALMRARTLTVKKISSDVNAVTVATPSGQLIDGVSTSVLTSRWDSISIMGAD